MIKRLKTLTLRFLPQPILERLKPHWIAAKRAKFLSQGVSSVKVGGTVLEIPAHHPLPQLMVAQPNRDQCVAIAAKFFGEKYPDRSMIDIGANVGDTAALICESCENDLILVEASDFYFPFLEKNAVKFKNSAKLVNAIVSDGNDIKGELVHWGGTAELHISDDLQASATTSLEQLTDTDVCFLKTDTDGHDFKILLAGISWVGLQKTGILLESQIRTKNDFNNSVKLFEELAGFGYDRFIVWDDACNHIISTVDASVVIDLHRFLLANALEKISNKLSDLDILCIHSRDLNIYNSINDKYRK